VLKSFGNDLKLCSFVPSPQQTQEVAKEKKTSEAGMWRCLSFAVVESLKISELSYCVVGQFVLGSPSTVGTLGYQADSVTVGNYN